MSEERAQAPADADAGLDAADAGALAKLVGDATDEQLTQLMASESRQAILDDIFRRMAEHVDEEKAQGVTAVLHWKILDRRPDGGYDHYEVVLENATVTVSEEPSRDPTVTIKVGPADFLKLVSGNASGPTMFMTGKLKIEGDIFLASRLTALFHIPKAE
jgi:putative sterol carrier protein